MTDRPPYDSQDAITRRYDHLAPIHDPYDAPDRTYRHQTKVP